MKPRQNSPKPQTDLFRQPLVNLLDLRHELCKLSELIDWQSLHDEFAPLYGDDGRPGESIRLMCGLQYLKHAYAMSDEQVVQRWVENPYWQYFCGEEYFCHILPVHPTSMTKFRNRIKAKGCELLLSLTVDAGIKSQTVDKSSLSEVVVDSTVMEKAVAFPTDAKLLNRCREQLADLAKAHGLSLKQTFERKGKELLRQISGYGRARQFKRLAKGTKTLKTWLGRVSRSIERQLATKPELEPLFKNKLAQAKQLQSQHKHSKDKLYSLHAPEVECIGKGKAHKAYEFGVKVSIATTIKEQFVVASLAIPGNPYDGHTLKQTLEAVTTHTGRPVHQCFTDRGYKGNDAPADVRVFIAGQRRGVTTHFKRKRKRRNAIEAIIGHMKTDGLLGRNHLKGSSGDAMNALLCGAGQNLRKILKKLRLFWLKIWSWLLANFWHSLLSHRQLMQAC